MSWVVNIGNTTTTIANTDNIYRIQTHQYNSSESLLKLICNYNISSTDQFYIASVVDDKIPYFQGLFESCTILNNDDFSDIDTSQYINSKLGIDRLIAMHAAAQCVGDSFILYDLGTATTANIVINNQFLGGAITTGVKTTVTALTENTSNLFDVKLRTDVSLIGTSTSDSILSGAIYMTALYIDSYTETVSQQLNQKLPVVIIGGNSVFLEDKLKIEHQVEKNLIINYLVNKYCD